LPAVRPRWRRPAVRRSGAGQRAALAGAATILAVAGCGSDDPAAAPSTGRERASASSSGPGSRLEAVSFTRRMAEAIRDKGTVTVAVAGVAPLTVQLRMTPAQVDLEADRPGPRAWHLIVVDGAAYLRAEGARDGKHWIRLSGGPWTASSAPTAAALTPWWDPSAALSGLDGQLSAIRGGSAKVDGVRTTDYTVSLAGDQLAEAVRAAPGRAALPPGSSTVTRYSVDDAWLPRRIVVETLVPGQQVQVTSAVYQDWGGPVTITAPDPADTRPVAAGELDLEPAGQLP
jgi:hypothetical protein